MVEATRTLVLLFTMLTVFSLCCSCTAAAAAATATGQQPQEVTVQDVMSMTMASPWQLGLRRFWCVVKGAFSPCVSDGVGSRRVDWM